MFEWFTKMKLDRIGRRANPDRAFVASLEKRITSEMPRRFSAHWKMLAGSLTGISCLLVGTGAYAYTSDNVLPGHPLYSVRVELEQVEKNLAPTPEIRATVTVRQMQRRVREQELMNAKQRPTDEEQMQRFVGAAEATIDETSRLDADDRKMLDTKTAELEEKFASALKDSKDHEITEKEKKRVETILNRQTSRLQERVKKLDKTRRERFQALLDRGTHEAETSNEQSTLKEREESDDE